MSYLSMTDEQCKGFWKHHVIDAYKPLDSTDGWLRCNGCGQHPRVWIFDNGRHASCLCFDKYAPHPARAESIMSVYKRTGMTLEYKVESLMEAWNMFVQTNEIQNKLPEGQW